MREALLERLERGDVLVVDGGIGSELHRRGTDLLRKRAADDTEQWFSEAWSASANNDAPEVVGQVHADYLRVGADIILTNTFFTGPTRLSLIGADKDWQRYQDTAVEMALVTRDASNPDAYVFGTWSPPWMQDIKIPPTGAAIPSNTEFMGKDAFVSEMRAIGERMVDKGVDALQFEYIVHAEDVRSAVEAVGGLGVPLIIGLADVEADGNLRRGDTVALLEEPLAGGQVAGVVFMCTELEQCTPALRLLAEIYDGYTGASPNNGYGSPTKRGEHALDLFPNPDLPSAFAQAAGEWIEVGAQLIGGCCGTGPDHIRAIRHAVDTRKTAPATAAP
jgi:S-methylmethionine-dependent homocysteine/selenocysteine methylase